MTEQTDWRSKQTSYNSLKDILRILPFNDDDEVMLNVLRCQLTY